MKAQKIIFVYNADNGLFNALTDWAHKFFSPETYDCSLCRFTYGMTGMLHPWKKFIESLACPALFLHRPEFRQSYPDFKIAFPAVLIERDGQLRPLLSAEEIAAAGDLNGLIAITRLRFFDQQTTDGEDRTNFRPL